MLKGFHVVKQDDVQNSFIRLPKASNGLLRKLLLPLGKLRTGVCDVVCQLAEPDKLGKMQP